MKKIIILLLSVILIMSSVNCVFADNEAIQSFEMGYLGNGLYFIVTIEETQPMTCGLSSKKATKVYTITSRKGEKQAKYRLKRGFLYSGSASSYIVSSYDTMIYDSEYKFTFEQFPIREIVQ